MSTRTSDNLAIANRTAIAMASGYDLYAPLASLIFNDQVPTRRDEIMAIHAHDGSFQEVAEDANYPSADIVEVGSKTLTQKTYKKKLVISELMQRFDSEGAIMREAMRMGYDMNLSKDQKAADVLNLAFTTETTWDGQPIFSASHAIGATGFLQSNLVTGALGDTEFNSLIVALRGQKNHRNTPDPKLPRVLLVPIQLDKKGHELCDSAGNPEASNLNLNTYRSKGITVISWELLTSTTAHFLLSDKLFHSLTMLQALAPRIRVRGEEFTESGSDEVRARYAAKFGCPDYEGLAASLGT